MTRQVHLLCRHADMPPLAWPRAAIGWRLLPSLSAPLYPTRPVDCICPLAGCCGEMSGLAAITRQVVGVKFTEKRKLKHIQNSIMVELHAYTNPNSSRATLPCFGSRIELPTETFWHCSRGCPGPAA